MSLNSHFPSSLAKLTGSLLLGLAAFPAWCQLQTGYVTNTPFTRRLMTNTTAAQVRALIGSGTVETTGTLTNATFVFGAGGSNVQSKAAAEVVSATQFNTSAFPLVLTNAPGGGGGSTDLTHVTNWVNVTRYGVVGDNSTDDRAAFQSAINAAQSYTNRFRLWIPSGTYRIGGHLYITNQVELVGAGQNESILNFTNTADDGLRITNTITGPKAGGITIKGMRLQGPGLGTSTGIGMKFDGNINNGEISGALVQGVLVQGFKYGVWLDNVGACSFDNLALHYNWIGLVSSNHNNGTVFTRPNIGGNTNIDCQFYAGSGISFYGGDFGPWGTNVLGAWQNYGTDLTIVGGNWEVRCVYPQQRVIHHAAGLLTLVGTSMKDFGTPSTNVFSLVCSNASADILNCRLEPSFTNGTLWAQIGSYQWGDPSARINCNGQAIAIGKLGDASATGFDYMIKGGPFDIGTTPSGTWSPVETEFGTIYAAPTSTNRGLVVWESGNTNASTSQGTDKLYVNHAGLTDFTTTASQQQTADLLDWDNVKRWNAVTFTNAYTRSYHQIAKNRSITNSLSLATSTPWVTSTQYWNGTATERFVGEAHNVTLAAGSNTSAFVEYSITNSPRFTVNIDGSVKLSRATGSSVTLSNSADGEMALPTLRVNQSYLTNVTFATPLTNYNGYEGGNFIARTGTVSAALLAGNGGGLTNLNLGATTNTLSAASLTAGTSISSLNGNALTNLNAASLAAGGAIPALNLASGTNVTGANVAYSTNAWTGPTNAIDLNNTYQRYALVSGTGLSITNSTIGSASQLNWAVLFLRNDTGSNLTLTITAPITGTGDGARSWTITNATTTVVSMNAYGNAATNAIVRSLW